MYMAYSNNPQLPKVRMQAVKLVRQGWSQSKVARHLGYGQGTVSKWVAKAPEDKRKKIIPTLSSRPLHHPHELDPEVVRAIIAYRRKYERGAEVLQALLRQDGILVSLSSVKRTLRREEMTYPSKWKKWHTYPPRPAPEKPGILVEVDTIHDGAPEDRLYIYTMIDVYSRFAYATPSLRISTHHSLRFVEAGRIVLPFEIRTIQSDHGPEFSKYFTTQVESRGLSHRHSRIRTPNDNAHLERFNRTIQDECLRRCSRSLAVWRREIPEYLRWYNEKRPHLGLEMKTPRQKLEETIPSY